MSEVQLVASIDQSTTSTKFTIFDVQGRVVENDFIEHEQITKQSGWLEHDPEEILVNLRKVITRTLEKLSKNHKDLSAKNIRCLGVTNQRETVLAWNKVTGKPYHNAIVWNDARTADICKRWAEKHNNNKNHYQKINGLPINTYFSGFKIRWLLENVPQIAQDLEKDEVLFGTMDSWVIYNLTEKCHVTDVTNASRTFLMNLETLRYEQSILEEFGIPERSLPQIRSSSEKYCEISFEPLKGIPVTAILGDQQAASIGHGVFDIGSSKNTYGTGCFFLINIGDQIKFSQGGLITTVLYQLGKDAKPIYGFEGSIEVGASTILWARDKLNLFENFEGLEQQMAQTQDNGGVYFVPAFTGLLAPYWNQDVKGTIVGLSFNTDKNHIMRAVLEAIAFRVNDILESIKQNDIKIESLKVDGGVTKNRFLMQFQSDLIGKNVLKTKVEDSTSLGVAFAAGLSLGIWQSLDQIKGLIQLDQTYSPDQKQDLSSRYQKWIKATQVAQQF